MNAAGATPLADWDGLIPKLSTQGELNEWERQNILVAQDWAFRDRVLARTDPLNEDYIRRLHRKMFSETWEWAGIYRTADGFNLGCPFYEIRDRIGNLIADVRYWVEHKTFEVDEIAVRYHYRIVGQIHGFRNGNGRHARLLADVFAVKNGRPRFTWGRVNLTEPGPRREAYLAALCALDDGHDDVRPLLEFARS